MHKFFFLLIILFFTTGCKAQVHEYNILKFGAIPNDGKDDTEAFRKCFITAEQKSNATITIPLGAYDVHSELKLSFLNATISIIGEKQGEKVPVIRSKSDKNILFIQGYFSTPSVGSISIKNLKLLGANMATSTFKTKINKDNWNAGILIIDKSQAILENVEVADFYGQGIHIATTKTDDIPLNARFSNVIIKNCKILNVWGSNPKKDNYGDGIYIAATAKATIADNYISNSITDTKHLGRGGIVVEYVAENVLIKNNRVDQGYDRALHIEATLGGHNIIDNYFGGSDLSFVLAEFHKIYIPLKIENNTFTNTGLPKNSKLDKYYAAGNFGDRALVFLVTSGVPRNSIIFSNNTFRIDSASYYHSNSILNNRSPAVAFLSNRFENKLPAGVKIFNYSKGNFSNNSIDGKIEMQ